MNLENVPRINMDEPDYDSNDSWNFILAAITTKDGKHSIKTVMRVKKRRGTEDDKEYLEKTLGEEIANTETKGKILREGSMRFHMARHYNPGKKVVICMYGGFHRSIPDCATIALILEGKIYGIECLEYLPSGD